MNLGTVFAEKAGQYRHKTAVVLGDRRVSFQELNEASDAFAGALLGLGVGKGDHVAVLLPNSIEFGIIFLGIAKIGAIATLLDVKYKTEELASLFADSEPGVLISEGPCLEPLLPELPRFAYIKHVIDIGLDYSGRFHSYRQLMASAPSTPPHVQVSGEDTAILAYTSGPTIGPHGVMVSHASLLAEAGMGAEAINQTGKDVAILFALPMHHAFGLTGVWLTTLLEGGTVVMVPGTGISIHTLIESIEKERGTIFFSVPYIFALLNNIAEREGVTHDLSSLRLCGSAGAPLPLDVSRRFKHNYGFDLYDFFGLTEGICHVTFPPLNGSFRMGSVGKPLSGWKLRIVDDRGRELPPNQSGEIVISGPFMQGYYRNPEATARAIKDGWLHTGDLGCVDEDGYYYVTGRKKNMIIMKGQNIYPSDIEHVLRTHPKIAGAVAVGAPDDLRGEIVRALVKLKDGVTATEEEIRQFCLKRMADYKAPKQVMFVDSLPRTTTPWSRKDPLRG